MPKALCQSQRPQFLSLFPDWSGPRPLRFFLLENLLEARQGSVFPTNIAGPDEDVNIYLAGMLTNFLKGQFPQDVVFGAGSQLNPPAKHLSRRQRAQFYRNNADHRLIMLGLFDRGDHLRRRPSFFGMSRQEGRQRDLQGGVIGYHMAANLLENRKMGCGALVDIWRKLAENFELYVQVLSTMAVSRLGFGANLSSAELQFMTAAPATANPSASHQMDRLLDLLLEMRQPGGHKKRAEVYDLALHLNLDPEKLLHQAGDQFDRPPQNLMISP